MGGVVAARRHPRVLRRGAEQGLRVRDGRPSGGRDAVAPRRRDGRRPAHRRRRTGRGGNRGVAAILGRRPGCTYAVPDRRAGLVEGTDGRALPVRCLGGRGRRTGRGVKQTVAIRVLASADVDDRAELGDGTTVWHLAQVREGARLGRDCIVGRGAYVGTGVQMGDNCKLQNYALVYEPAVLENGVFVGPAAVLTNDLYPRSIDPEGKLKRGDDWEAVGVTIREGASIGARAVCVAPVTIGRWATVAAGAVVTKDVPDFALVAGVPARRIGWVGRAGERLVEGAGSGQWRC